MDIKKKSRKVIRRRGSRDGVLAAFYLSCVCFFIFGIAKKHCHGYLYIRNVTRSKCRKFGTLLYVYVGEVGEGENGGVMQLFSLMLAMSYVLMAIDNCVLEPARYVM